MDFIDKIILEDVSLKCAPRMHNINSMVDSLDSFSFVFNAPKVYSVINKDRDGAWALSYLLAGRVRSDKGRVCYSDGSPLDRKQLFKHGAYVGEIPYKRSILGKKKYLTVESLLFENSVRSKSEVLEIAEALELSPTRLKRPLHQISNERWNASVAIGLSQGKTVFCFPLLNREWKERIYVRLKTCSYLLKKYRCITIIPSDNEKYLTKFTDEIINL